jgi:hypothetical protein
MCIQFKILLNFPSWTVLLFWEGSNISSDEREDFRNCDEKKK